MSHVVLYDMRDYASTSIINLPYAWCLNINYNKLNICTVCKPIGSSIESKCQYVSWYYLILSLSSAYSSLGFTQQSIDIHQSSNKFISPCDSMSASWYIHLISTKLCTTKAILLIWLAQYIFRQNEVHQAISSHMTQATKSLGPVGPQLPLPNGIRRHARNHRIRLQETTKRYWNLPFSYIFNSQNKRSTFPSLPFLALTFVDSQEIKGEHVKTTPRLMRLFGTSLSANKTPPRWCPNPTGAKNGNGHRHMAAFMKATASRVKIGI